MRACLDGAEVPPWDVVESLLQDLAAVRGTGFAERESVRAAALYFASATAYDRRPGGRNALAERLELMLGERALAARRLSAPGPRRRPGRGTTWRAPRHAARSYVNGWRRSRVHRAPGPGGRRGRRRVGPSRKRPRGARFAGLEADEDAGSPPSSIPALPVPPTAPAAAPRGARFSGAQAEGVSDRPARNPGPVPWTPPPAGSPTTRSNSWCGCARRAVAVRRTWCSARRRPGRRNGCPYSLSRCTVPGWPPTGPRCCGRCPRPRPWN
ncbi:hypothetical protein NKH18_42770 [Streptomyces sp. M10(2022)]